MKNKTNADFLFPALFLCMYIYIYRCVYTNNYFLVAYQKDLLEFHDLALGKKNMFS